MRYSPLGNGAPATSPDGVCAVLGEQAHIVLLTHNSQDKESSALSISEAVFEPYETKQYNRLPTITHNKAQTTNDQKFFVKYILVQKLISKNA